MISKGFISSLLELMDKMVRGMVGQKGEDWDNVFSDNVLNHLFEVNPLEGGMDLVALNIQRGRDHGLPGYTAYLERLGRRKPKNFDDLRSHIDDFSVRKLEKVYKDVDDIDLFVGKFAK